MMEMNPVERVFLRVEQQDHPVDSMGIFLLDPTDDGPLPFEAAQAAIAARAAREPVLRRMIAQTTYGMGEERWMDSGNVTLAHHLVQVTVPQPADLRCLLDLALRLGRAPLDRRRPLWKAWYADGLADGRTALLVRAHHALTPGLGGIALARELFDPTPLPADPGAPIPMVIADPAPTTAQLLRRGIPQVVSVQWNAARQAAQLARAGLRRGGAEAADEAPRSTHRTPVTVFDTAVRSPAKSLGVVSLPLADFDEIRSRRNEFSFGDLLQAVLCGGLRRYFERIGEVPDGQVKVAIPMMLDSNGTGMARPSAAHSTLSITVLPTDEADPQTRLAIIHARNRRRLARYDEARRGTRMATVISGLFHPAVVSVATTVLGSSMATLVTRPPFNLAFTAQRAPDAPVYFAGAKVANMYGRTLVIPPMRVFVHAVVYDGKVEVGVTALREVLPDPDLLLDAIRDELAELLAGVTGAQGR